MFVEFSLSSNHCSFLQLLFAPSSLTSSSYVSIIMDDSKQRCSTFSATLHMFKHLHPLLGFCTEQFVYFLFDVVHSVITAATATKT